MTQTLDAPPALEPLRQLGFGTFGNVSTFTPTPEEWRGIQDQLAAPFDPSEVLFRKTNGSQVAAYISAQTVYQRLDDVVGPGGWSKKFEPLVIEEVTLKWGEKDFQTKKFMPYTEQEILQKGLRHQEVTKGVATITIHGISKDGVGTLSNTDPSKGCESDAVKRAAMAWGIFRYICNLPKIYTQEQGFSLSDGEIQRLRDTYLTGNVSTHRTVGQVEAAGFRVDETRTAPRPQAQSAPQRTSNTPLPRYPNEQEEARLKPSPDQLEWPDGFNPAMPQCPTCSGSMWDNRQKKASGQFKATSADFSCKNKGCLNEKGFVTGVWGQEPKNGPSSPPAASPRTREQVAQEAHHEHDQGYANAMDEDDDPFGDE